jgi:hypothetical protein
MQPGPLTCKITPVNHFAFHSMSIQCAKLQLPWETLAEKKGALQAYVNAARAKCASLYNPQALLELIKQQGGSGCARGPGSVERAILNANSGEAVVGLVEVAEKCIPVSFCSMRNEDNLSTEIRELKKDVTELSELLRILAGFVQMPATGTEEEKSAIEFETRLAAILEKHARDHHLTKQIDAIEGETLKLPTN